VIDAHIGFEISSEGALENEKAILKSENGSERRKIPGLKWDTRPAADYKIGSKFIKIGKAFNG
jgi:hypothetical protein